MIPYLNYSSLEIYFLTSINNYRSAEQWLQLFQTVKNKMLFLNLWDKLYANLELQWQIANNLLLHSTVLLLKNILDLSSAQFNSVFKCVYIVNTAITCSNSDFWPNTWGSVYFFYKIWFIREHRNLPQHLFLFCIGMWQRTLQKGFK